MTVHVQLFARVREIVGASALDVELSPAAGVGDCFRHLVRMAPDLARLEGHLLVAVNEEYVGWDQQLREGDRVTFIPPVSGG